MDMESATQEIQQGYLATAWSKIKEFAAKLKNWITKAALRTKKLGEDDPRRIIHSLKVGMALTLVSLLYYVRPMYDSFGVSGMWAVLTVVVVFEFTVGGTLSKGLNRGFGTILAGGLGIGAQSLASLFGDKGEPFVLGILVFILATAATFSRFFPKIKARYDYGVLIFILTFSLVSISGYRVDKILEMAHQRLSTILIGGATCILISIFIYPVWAGETLHNSIASNIEKVANYLEGFGGEYFHCSEDGDGDDGVSMEDRSFLRGYKSVLHSQSSEETLSNFASWEPGHGRFLLRHPWKQYLKIGALTRSCAYKIEAINSYIISDHKVELEFQRRIEEPCRKMSSESSKALKILASGIKTMTHPSSSNSHVENAKAAINDLKIELQAASLDMADLHAIAQAATIASILVDIVKSVEELSHSVEELSRLARFKQSIPQDKSQILHRGTIEPVLDSEIDNEYIIITVNDHTIKTNAPKSDIRG